MRSSRKVALVTSLLVLGACGGAGSDADTAVIADTSATATLAAVTTGLSTPESVL